MSTIDHLQPIAADWFAHPESIPRFAPPRYARRRVRLWHYPSLRGPWVSVFIYEGEARRFRPSGMSPVVEVTWDRDADVDLARKADPATRSPETPSVTWRECLVATDTVRRCYEGLQQLTFQPFSRSGSGTDGFVRGVEATLGLGTTSVAWWGRAPGGFEPLARWYTEVWNDVQREMDSAQGAMALGGNPNLPPAGSAPHG